MPRWCPAVVVACALTAPSPDGRGEEAKLDPRPPYFNFEMRQMLIEGSFDIEPTPPVVVGNTRQLLMDDHVVDDAWGCRRTVHSPRKHPDNPVIHSDPVEIASAGDGTVLREGDRFRLWSRAWFKTRPKYAPSLVQNYYESTDGLQWTAPALGVIEHDGSKANNLIQGGPGLIYATPSVIAVPSRLRSRGRYAMLYGFAKEKYGPGEHHGMEQRVAWSDDGTPWRDQEENPVFRGRSDTFNNMVYNPQRDVFMMYRRATVNAHQIRRVAYSESRDLVTWTQPKVILRPDELDPSMLYGMVVTRYQSAYLGFLQMFYSYQDLVTGASVPGPKSHQIDIQLAWSRDGIQWERHPERPIFLETGPPGSYDWGMVFVAQGLPEVDDQVYVFYQADQAFHIGADVKRNRTGNLCLATLRRDGFVSLDAPTQGYMLTKPLRCPGGELHINAKTAADGFVRVAVRRGDGVRDGDWCAGLGFDGGPQFTGDSTDAVIRWQNSESIEPLANEAIRLHFWMQKAELYSFWFES